MTADDSVLIRPATPDDTVPIWDMVCQLADYEKLQHLLTGSPSDLNRELFGDQPTCEALVAETHETLIGYAIFFHNFSTFLCRPGLYLEDVFVKPEHRNRGVGKKLLLAVGAEARRRKCARFEWTVLDWNEPAIDFYRSMGAEILPDWRVVRLDQIGLAKLLDANASQ